MLSKLGCLLFVLSFGNSFCSSQDDLPEIDTPLGRVQGYWKTIESITYAAFEGIPYAKPPVGDLRFEESEPIPAWSGTWVANAPYLCLQGSILSSDETLSGAEDCLYLNVYIPEDSVKNPKALDVIVSIHGGAFMAGSGSSDLNTFLEKDVVLVSFNYRVGILGFLSTEDDVIPGNNGLKDQVLALKWVRDNIASFGGNPDSVTIVGLSAGAASVHLHYFSPLSKGLFVRGMSQSGSALAPWAIKKNALQSAKKLAVLVGCPDSPSEELKKCLKQTPAEDLLKQLKYFRGYGIMPFAPFAPVVEKGSPNAFLDAEPYQLVKEGKVHDVPWIAAYTTGEGLLITGFLLEQLEEVDEKWVEIAPYLLNFNDTLSASDKETVAKEVLDYYLGPGEKIDKKNFKKFTQIITDRLFAVPAELSVRLQANVTKSPVYHYIFNYTEGVNRVVYYLMGTDDIEGVCHAEDGIYFYGLLHYKPLSDQDKRLVTACQNILYSYASSGVPSFDGTDVWQPTGSEELTYLFINGPESMKLHKSESVTPMEFWSKLGLLHNEIPVKNEL
ncbi:venom carboxylesterase-6 isoform X1 [Anoplophora glabripennis]|uniref:venom carboxylesterase-6 isoform X1 n=1 Tax=Anoplophora glabripennis TaxID=217634 RepID=UPI000C7903BB|nr:venom carboxylesterase-6 isoform X1 [Anoplophora glabripennis]